jgi:hypothetical protein
MEHPVIIDSRGKATKDMRGPIAKFIASNVGRIQLATAMAAPLRRNIDYHGIARRCIMVEPLPQGAQIIYTNVCDDTSTEDSCSTKDE